MRRLLTATPTIAARQTVTALTRKGTMTTPYHESEGVTLYKANALDLPLADDSVDLVVTSPPYFGLRSYKDGGDHYDGQIGAEATPAEFVDALIAATREMVRVTKPTGSIWVNLGDKYARNGGGGAGSSDGMTGRNKGGRPPTKTPEGIREKSLVGFPWRYALRCIDDLGLILRAEVVWSKPNGLPESVKDRVRRSHETWFHFTLEQKYFSAVDTLRDTTPTGRIPGSVWNIATEPLRVPEELGVNHFAAFPTEWPRRIIQGWAPEGGVVLDPFSGTGTTALVASVLGRHGIGVDMSEDYCRLAAWRTTDPKQRVKAARQKYKAPKKGADQ